MASALRRFVPLNAMCSSMCETPLTAALSWRAPMPTQTPMAAVSIPSM
jgi:hypothetical protein